MALVLIIHGLSHSLNFVRVCDNPVCICCTRDIILIYTMQNYYGSAGLVFVILIPIMDRGEYYVEPNLDLGTFVDVCVYIPIIHINSNNELL
jgi:hypothetical protein